MVKAYYRRVEYIESTGTQYIDTGIIGKSKSGVYIEAAGNTATGNVPLFGARDALDTSYYNSFAIWRNTSTTGLRFDFANENTTSVVSSNTWDTTIVNKIEKQGYLNYTNGVQRNSNTNHTFYCNYTFYLFTINTGGEATGNMFAGKVYACKIYNNGELVRDFIPVLDKSMTPCLYDNVTGNLFYNKGTGQFNYGGFVDEGIVESYLHQKLATMLSQGKKQRKYYCEVEYLHADGNQYINTGLLSTALSKVDVTYSFDTMESGADYNCAIFGGRNNTTNHTFTLFKLASGNPQYFRFDFNGQPQVGNSNNLTWTTDTKYRFTYDGSLMAVNTVNVKEAQDTASRTPGSTFTPTPICLFCVNHSSSPSTLNPTQFMKGNIYHYWYTDGTTTIDLVPVLDWNMRPAMYDKIHDELYYNQGTGEFTYGREIHYVEYLESSGTQWINTYVDPSLYNTQVIDTTVKFSILTPGSTSYTGYTGIFGAAVQRLGIYGRENNICIGYSSAYDYVKEIEYGKIYVANMNATKGAQSVTLDGTKIWSAATTTSLTADYSVGLFCRNSTTAQWMNNARIYYYKMSGTSVDLFFIPAIDENGVGYMLDRVSHTIFDNAGTGKFKYPAREVEYINFDGTQYIQTEFNTTNATSFKYEVKFDLSSSVTNAEPRVLSNEGTGSGKYFDVYYVTSSDKLICRPPAAGISLTAEKATVFKYSTTSGKIQGYYEDNPNTLIYDSNATFTAPTVNINYKIGSRGNNAASQYLWQGKIYYVYLERDGLTCNFVSAFKDGVAGMLDKVNNVFYQNAGTGDFIAGKIKELEYK